jgi:short-subunit dehydrogenase
VKKFRSILITGASNGIGKALADRLAEPGVFIAISGRTSSDLQLVCNQCQAKGATVLAKAIDVTDQKAMSEWITNVDKSHPLDLVIANAGISIDTSGKLKKTSQLRRVLDTNIFGVLNTIEPILPKMVLRQKGTIALMSSLAGFHGMASAPGYSSSKAWVLSYGQGLRGKFFSKGIRVSVICPGFIKSRITQKNKFFMPLLMDTQKAATIIINSLEKDKAQIAFPFLLYVLVVFLSFLPSQLTDKFANYFPKKE